MKPRVSVLVPATRADDLLRQALRSVLEQDFADLEILVSDDSADGAVRGVAEAFGDPRLRVLQGPRAGQVANTAFLWEQAGGELLKYLHDDDYLLPGALSGLVEPLDQLPHASFSFVQRHNLLPDGTLTGDEPDIRSRIYVEKAVVNDILGGAHNPIGEPTCSMFRRSSLDSIGTYEGFRIRSLIDVAMYLKAVERGPCVGVHRYLAVVRTHAGQFSWTSPERSAGIFEWELLIRTELRRGRLSREAALKGIKRLLHFYHLYRERYPDVAIFIPGLERFGRELMQGRVRKYLDQDYRRAWKRAGVMVDARR